MKKITTILKEKDFTVSVEIVPPRNGENPDEVFQRISKLKDMVDFFSVTKGAGGSLRGGTLPISYFIQKKFGINVIAHFVCRERTRQEIENELVDLHYFNIKNVLALRGDPPAGSTQGWDGDYRFAYLLSRQIGDMNKGRYIPRNDKEKPYKKGIKTDFCIVVAGHPEDNIEDEIKHMQAKIDEGAEAIITQMVFDADVYRNYVDGLKKQGMDIPVIPGIRPLRNIKQADSVENFFGIKVPKQIKEGLKKEGEGFGIRYFRDYINKLREIGAPGVHLFVLNDIDIVNEII